MTDYANSKCRITGQMCTAWSDVDGCGLVRCKFVEEKGGDKRVTDSRKSCTMRHENGNCTVAGGFCTAVNDPICEALHNAFDCGYRSALRQQEHFRDSTKMVGPLTLDELRKMDGEPVWIHFIGGAVIRNDGWFIVSQIGTSEIFLSGKVSVYKNFWYYGETWLAYHHKPEEDDHG